MGIAPLRLKDGILYFIGSANVCDFLDFVIQPGREDIFWDTLLQHLRLSNHKVMDLSPCSLPAISPLKIHPEILERMESKYGLLTDI